MSNLQKEIASLLNAHCAENGSDTPDFILAEYLMTCLTAFDAATKAREEWHGLKTDRGRNMTRLRSFIKDELSVDHYKNQIERLESALETERAINAHLIRTIT